MEKETNQTSSFEMSSISFEEIITDEWNALFEMTPIPIMERVTETAFAHIDELLEKYTEYLETEASLKAFLHTDEIRAKWIGLFDSWVRQLFSMKFVDANHFVEVQNDIGQKLSRIGYPPHAVNKALRIIKSWVLYHIFHQSWSSDEKMQAVMYVTNLIGLSFEVRNHGYMKGVTKQSRLDETFRLTAISNNMAMERERQRAFLSEWEKNIFAWLYLPSTGGLQRLSQSEFGIWFLHKASLMFEHAPNLDDVGKCIQHIDQKILPELEQLPLQQHDAIRAKIDLIEHQLVKIKFIMNEVFETHMQFENAKDVLTKLLNRRFMHTVLSREINLQRRAGSVGFAVLLLDLDHFKRINDNYGHTVGDMVLQRTASMVTNSVRPSDFTFRYGGEEILIVLVEIEPSHVVEIANKIRRNIEEHQLQLSDGEQISVTVSIGAVHAKGKYDYQSVINEADQALYQAKDLGRNKVYMSQGMEEAVF